VRKAFEAYGFPQLSILEECDYALIAEGAEYHWAELFVVGPNYGDLPIEGCILDTAILDSPNAYLGTGTFSKERIDDLVRGVVLEWRQVHDMVTLDNVTLDDANDGVEFAMIKGAHLLDEVCLDETSLDGFGV
jgi:hypothetical protein